MNGRDERHHEAVQARRRRAPARLRPGRAHARPPWRRAAQGAAHGEGFVRSLGALRAPRRCRWSTLGFEAIYVSGWQVAADANLAGHAYPDQSLYPADSVPQLVRRINNALLRADQISTRRGDVHAVARPRRSPTPRPASAGRSTRTS